MGLYRWGNAVVVSSMFIARLLEVNGSNDKSCLQSVFGGGARLRKRGDGRRDSDPARALG